MLNIQVVRDLNGKVASALVVDARERFSTENRNDWKTFEAAQEVATSLGSDYIATDAGAHVSPRYDVQALPKVGEPVSYAFNGDYYPCGKITAISATLKKITAKEEDGTEHHFYRVRQSGSWRKDGTWSLVSGHISKLNPSF